LQSFFFDRDDIALPGFAKYFKKSSDEEREHAEKLMKFQNQRGGRVVLQSIQVSSRLHLPWYMVLDLLIECSLFS
jgi:ferritin heavy chain